MRSRSRRDLPLIAAVGIAALALLSGCGTAERTASGTMTASTMRPGFAHVALQVPAANRAFGRTHTVTLPRGWSAPAGSCSPTCPTEAPIR